ncbi:DoxX family protein [Streptomyces griseus]|uniref:DoxX family protein n=1 Tax=Streptomyces griseus TaxID=1911 RepID=UPI00056C4BF5|nr:DoxX family protein [Streptomyces griseus]
MSEQDASPGKRPARAVEIAGRVCHVLLVVVFLAAGSAKLAGAAEMVDAFDTIGAGPWPRYCVGVIEITGVLGLLVPRLVGLAALGLAALMIGAIITNVVIDAFSLLAVVLLLLSATVAWGRRNRTKALAGGTHADEFAA